MLARLNAQMSSTIGWAVFGLCCIVLAGYALHGLTLVWDLILQLRIDEHGAAYVFDAHDRVIGLKMVLWP